MPFAAFRRMAAALPPTNTAADVAQLRQERGLDDPWVVELCNWLRGPMQQDVWAYSKGRKRKHIWTCWHLCPYV